MHSKIECSSVISLELSPVRWPSASSIPLTNKKIEKFSVTSSSLITISSDEDIDSSSDEWRHEEAKLKHWGDRWSIAEVKSELNRCVRDPGERLADFATRLRGIADKISTDIPRNERVQIVQDLLVKNFIEGIDTRLANEVLRKKEYFNIDDALEAAEDCEKMLSRLLHRTRHDELRLFDRFKRRDERRSHIAPYHETGCSRLKYLADRHPYMSRRCARCGNIGHYARGCITPPKFFCFECGDSDHRLPCVRLSGRPRSIDTAK